MDKLLLIVSDRFLIPGRGILLTLGINANVQIGEKIKLVHPDNIIIQFNISGITFEHRTILVANFFNKEEIPIGTEVWLLT